MAETVEYDANGNIRIKKSPFGFSGQVNAAQQHAQIMSLINQVGTTKELAGAAANPFDQLRILGDKGMLGNNSQGDKNLYASMQEQKKTDADVAGMLKGITQMQKMSPGRPKSLIGAPLQSNTLLTLLGNV